MARVHVEVTTYAALPVVDPLAASLAVTLTVYVDGVALAAEVAVKVTVVDAPEPSVTEVCVVDELQPTGTPPATANVELPQPASRFVIVAV